MDGKIDAHFFDKFYLNSEVKKLVATKNCVMPEDCSCLFYDANKQMSNLTVIDLSAADFSHVKNMSYMFFNCSSVESIILTGIDTSNVTDMNRMFMNCYDLNYVDLIGVDTSGVTDMSLMFGRCTDLVDIDLSELDMSSVTDMSSMFYYCISLKWVDASFDAPSLQKAEKMFESCDSIKYIYVKPELRSMIDDTPLPNFTDVIVV